MFTVHIHKMLELSVLHVSNIIYSLFVLTLTLPFLYPKAMKYIVRVLSFLNTLK